MTTPALRQVALAKLKPDPNQPRKSFDEASIKALAENIRARGMHLPILATEGKKGELIILDGERRWRAAKLAKLKTVPVLIRNGATDALQRGADQIAVNSMREELRPMELARWIAARQAEKLTPNDIAARLQKDGMKALTPARIEALAKLTRLPDWLTETVDAGQVEAEDAAIALQALDHPPAMKELQGEIPRELGWKGRLTRRELEDAVRGAFMHTAVNLTRTESWHGKDAVHFAWAMRCKGCEHLRKVSGTGFCLSAKLFAEHNAEAKAAGLGPGGKRPEKSKEEKPLTPKQQAKRDQQKAEQREQSLERKQADYLRDWCRERNASALAGGPDTAESVALFTAFGWPGSWTQPVVATLRSLAGGRKLLDLQAFLDLKDVDGRGALVQLAATVAGQLDHNETFILARRLLGEDLAKIWRIDEAYLALLRKAELVPIAEKYATLPEGKRSWEALRGDELKTAILAAAASIPPRPELVRIYGEKRVPQEIDVDDEEDLGDPEELDRAAGGEEG